MDVRVDRLNSWLRLSQVPYCVDHCTTVQQFEGSIKSSATPYDLIILDHDLGPGSNVAGDENGQCGLDGAKLIPDNCDSYIIIWSTNAPAGREMSLELRDRGCHPLVMSFLKSNESALKSVILESLRD